MVYSYLLDLYRVLADKEQEIKTQLGGSGLSANDREYLQGRLTAVKEFTEFLRGNFHEKLPKRLQKIK